MALPLKIVKARVCGTWAERHLQTKMIRQRLAAACKEGLDSPKEKDVLESIFGNCGCRGKPRFSRILRNGENLMLDIFAIFKSNDYFSTDFLIRASMSGSDYGKNNFRFI